jgi:hypothetical protein
MSSTYAELSSLSEFAVIKYAKKLKLEEKTINKIMRLFRLLDESDDRDYIKALLLKICAGIGEFIDLLGQPDCSNFGFKHNNSTRESGINHPIKKILDELRAILTGLQDNKFLKRQERFNFLNAFAPVAPEDTEIAGYFDTIFSKMCNWVNGGPRDNSTTEGSVIDDEDEDEDEDEDRTSSGRVFKGDKQHLAKIIITASGGNLITFFAQFMKYYLLTPADRQIQQNEVFDEIIEAFEKYSGIAKSAEHIQKEIEDYVTKTKVILEDGKTEVKLSDQITNMAKKPFSDVDLKLGPNKRGNFNPKLESTVPNIQFLLTRFKIEKLCDTLFTGLTVDSIKELQEKRKKCEETWRTACYNFAKEGNHTLTSPTLDNLYAGLMKDEYLAILEDELMLESLLQDMGSALNSETDLTRQNTLKKCLKYLLSLSIRKDVNDKATADNIATISDLQQFEIAEITKNLAIKQIEHDTETQRLNINKKQKTKAEKAQTVAKSVLDSAISAHDSAKLALDEVINDTSIPAQKLRRLINASTKAKTLLLKAEIDKTETEEAYQTIERKYDAIEEKLSQIIEDKKIIEEELETKLRNKKTPTEQLMKLMRKITIVGNKCINKYIPKECDESDIDRCFSSSSALLTERIQSTTGSISVIELTSHILGEILSDTGIKTKTILETIRSSYVGASLGTTNASIQSNFSTSHTDIMDRWTTSMIANAEATTINDGLRIIGLVLDANSDDTTLDTSKDELSSQGSQGSQGLQGSQDSQLLMGPPFTSMYIASTQQSDELQQSQGSLADSTVSSLSVLSGVSLDYNKQRTQHVSLGTDFDEEFITVINELYTPTHIASETEVALEDEPHSSKAQRKEAGGGKKSKKSRKHKTKKPKKSRKSKPQKSRKHKPKKPKKSRKYKPQKSRKLRY